MTEYFEDFTFGVAQLFTPRRLSDLKSSLGIMRLTKTVSNK